MEATIYPVIAEYWKLDGGACFGVLPKSLWTKFITPDNNNMIPIASRCLLVKSLNKVVLIDVGMGSKENEKYYSHFYIYGNENLINNLNKINIKPNDITDIIFTHLHWDHVGGATYKNSEGEIKLTFPNARYWCSQSGWEWANNPNPREAKAFFKHDLEPLKNSNKLNFISENCLFDDNIELEIYNGHTEGLIVPIINTKNSKVAFTTDFIASMAHIPLAYIPSQDIRPLVSMQEKEEFLNRAYKNNYILMFLHDVENECCRLEQTEKGIKGNTSFNWKNNN